MRSLVCKSLFLLLIVITLISSIKNHPDTEAKRLEMFNRFKEEINTKVDNGLHTSQVAEIIGIQKEWKKKYTGQGVTVAILDTGVYPHSDLIKPTNRIIAFKDYVNDRKKPYDDSGHGTLIAGIIAGNGWLNKLNKGLAPSAKIIVSKF